MRKYFTFYTIPFTTFFFSSFFFSLFLFASVRIVKSQTEITPLNSTITDGVYLSENTLVAVGTGGLIKKTTDNGATWQTKQSNTLFNFNVVIGNSNRLIAFGAGNTVLLSTDQGENWARMESPTKNRIFAACKFNDSEMVILGDSLIMRSNDGGRTFQDIDINLKTKWYEVVVNGLNTAVAVGNNHVIRTTDAGKNWVSVLDKKNAHFYGVDFYNDSLGIAYGDTVYITKDGGKNWREHKYTPIPISPYPYIIKFINDSLIIGTGGIGFMAISQDTGKTWSRFDRYPNLNGGTNIYKFIKNGKNAMMLGNRIAVCDSNFNILNLSSSVNDIMAVDVADFGEKIYIGYNNNSLVGVNYANHHPVSSDGGETWKKQDNCYTNMKKFFKFHKDSILALPGNLWYSNISVGWVSGNKGDTWRRVDVGIDTYEFQGGEVTEVACGKSNTIMFVMNGYRLLYSKDRGRNFYLAKINSLDTALSHNYSVVYMFDDTIGYACMRVVKEEEETTKKYTEHKILKTENGGKTWNEIYQEKQDYADTNLIHSIYFTNKQNGYMVGGTSNYGSYYKETKDGGKTWLSKNIGNNIFNTIKFLNNEEGFVLGNGVIKSSQDGGLSWEDYKIVTDTSMSLYNYRNYEISNDRKTMYLFTRDNYYTTAVFKLKLPTVIKSVGDENYQEKNYSSEGSHISVSIIPNPVKNMALLYIESNSGAGVAVLYNALGQESRRIEFCNTNPLSLDLSGLATGCYNAVIKTKLGVVVKKIVVN